MKQSRRAARLFTLSPPRDDSLYLDDRDAHYLSSVLRLRVGDHVTAFDGCGHEWHATIRSLTRRGGELALIESTPALPEPTLDLTLVQALVKSDAMDTIIQKATELGVTRIWPAISQFSVVQLDPGRASRRLAHWQRVARSACEQSGRHVPPEIRLPSALDECLDALATEGVKIALAPDAEPGMQWPTDVASAAVIVGPEGGFGPNDRPLLEAAGCLHLRLGGRVLRADTAAITACALAQQHWGDLV